MSELPFFAVRLREIRMAAKMTQEELAQRAGVTRVTIARLETGEREPSWSTVVAIANALGVAVTAFVPLVPEDKPAAEKPAPKTKRNKKS